MLRIMTVPRYKRAVAISNHQKKYYWMYNSYLEANTLDVEYFENELVKFETNKEGSLRILREIEEYSESIKKSKEKLLTTVGAGESLRDLVSLVGYFTKLQDTRKAINFKGDHLLEVFVNELEKRKEIKTDDLKFLLPNELVLEKPSLEAIRYRKKCVAFNCSVDGIEEVVGAEAESIYNLFTQASDVSQGTIHGMLASTGNVHYFRGVARIIKTIFAHFKTF